mmetsp:Transcript_40785/g.64198  ORF Transcript_40785/g.64198 Transcript_40785/m.64198 type:complete len:95 (-) Transcript_40785:311-595(-)
MPVVRFTSPKCLEDLAAAAAPIATCGESNVEATATVFRNVGKLPVSFALTLTFPDDHVDQIGAQIGAQIEVTEGVVMDVTVVTAVTRSTEADVL